MREIKRSNIKNVAIKDGNKNRKDFIASKEQPEDWLL